jgi:hypothetical protein
VSFGVPETADAAGAAGSGTVVVVTGTVVLVTGTVVVVVVVVGAVVVVVTVPSTVTVTMLLSKVLSKVQDAWTSASWPLTLLGAASAGMATEPLTLPLPSEVPRSVWAVVCVPDSVK